MWTSIFLQLKTLWDWFRELIGSVHVGVAELVSIYWTSAWALSLSIKPGLLETSSHLQNIEDHLPTIACRVIAYFLLILHVSSLMCCILSPSLPEKIFWMRLRSIGLLFGLFFWSVLTFLFFETGLSLECFQYPGLSVLCGWGIWKLSLMIQVDKNLDSYKAVSSRARELPTVSQPGI